MTTSQASQTKKRRRWPWVILTIVVLFFVLVALRRIRLQRLAQEAVQSADVVSVTVGDLAASATASGQVVAQRSADLALATSGRVSGILVNVGDQVTAGDVLVTLTATDLERAVATAQQALIIQQARLDELRAGASAEQIAAAQAAVTSAQMRLDGLLAGPNAQQVAAAEASVRAANANVWAASERLDLARVGPSQAEILQAQANLDAANNAVGSLERAYQVVLDCCLGPTEEQVRFALEAARASVVAAQQKVNELQAGADPNSVAAAQATLGVASANRDAAQANLALLQRGASETEIATAQSQLAQAQAALDGLLNGVSAEQLATAQAQVEQARIALQRTQNDLTKAQLTAPFDGIVTAIYIHEGEIAAGRAVSLIDTNSLEVVLSVGEFDLFTIAPGQNASITLEPFANTTISSTVVAIGPKSNAATDTGPASYDVHLSLQNVDLPVRVGMSANANLTTAERKGVLLVPNRAIIADRQSGKYYVNVIQGGDLLSGEVVRTEVTTGLRDAQFTEITGGLVEGDKIIIGEFTPPQPLIGQGRLLRGRGLLSGSNN